MWRGHETENQCFTTIILQIGWSKNHQLILNLWWWSSDEGQDTCMALSFLPTCFLLVIRAGGEVTNYIVEKFNSTLTEWSKSISTMMGTWTSVTSRCDNPQDTSLMQYSRCSYTDKCNHKKMSANLKMKTDLFIYDKNVV